MRILVVTQYFWPENFKINDLCLGLIERGHEVTVLTGVPNYPDGSIFPEFNKTPSNFTKYNGCNIIRVPIILRGKNSSIKLIMNYLTYFLSAALIGFWKLRAKDFDVIFVFGPSPITVALPAIFFRKLKKTPVIFWVLDLWPQTLKAIGVFKSNFLLKLSGQIVSLIYNHCDLILGQSKSFYDGISRYCKDDNKIKYFPNWPEIFFSEEAEFKIKEIEQYVDTFKVLFAGNIGYAQDFPAILKAAKILKKKKSNVKFFIVGDGRALEWVRSEINLNQLEEYVYLLGSYPLEMMPSFYASADALLATLKETPTFSMTIPGKIQSYMSSGKPILTMLTGEGSRVIEEAACGYVASSGNYELLAQNIITMSELDKVELMNFGIKAKHYVKKEFDRNKLISQLENWCIEVSLIPKK
jgi:colanic acid biosynthesis glycosyl transferase WcaI